LDYFNKDVENKFFVEDAKIDFTRMVNSLTFEETKSSIFENDEMSFSEDVFSDTF